MGFSIPEAAQLWQLMNEGRYDETRDDPRGILPPPPGKGEDDKRIVASITFEKDLEEHIVRNLNQIEKGIELYKRGRKSGRQFTIDFGIIDLLAKDKNGDFVVIELKGGSDIWSHRTNSQLNRLGTSEFD